MKNLLHTLMGCLLLVAMTACEKDTMPDVFAPKVETGIADNIYRKGATLSGSIQLSEGVKAESYGILFSNYQSMAEPKEMPVTSGETNFVVQVENLEPNETYYFCSYAYGGYSMVRGEVRSFTTSQSNAPVFQTPVVSNKTVSSFDITSTLLDDGGSELMLSGFCYNKVGERTPTFIDLVENVELSGNVITATITGLAPSTAYQIRAYGASGNGLAYSDLVTVTTETAVVPFLSAVEPTDTTLQSITVMASVLESGSAQVTEVGFCYSSTNSVPTFDDNVLPIANYTGGNFETTLQGLSFGSTYYIRAYAVNEYGIGYSEVFTYTPVQAEVAYLIDGPTFNKRIMELANNREMSASSYDYRIGQVKFITGSHTLPEKYVMVSANDSPAPIYISFNPIDSLLTVSTSAKDIEVVNASFMFNYLKNLHTIDFGNFEITKTTVNMRCMFQECESLTSLETSSWNTENVTDMSRVFFGCSSLTDLEISNWNTAKVTDMSTMFAWCTFTKLDISNWNIKNVTSMEYIFSECPNLKQLNMSNWDFNESISLSSIFERCAYKSQACEITTTQQVQDFLLNRLEVTGMNPLWFIWTNGNVDNGGSSVDDMPNQEW